MRLTGLLKNWNKKDYDDYIEFLTKTLSKKLEVKKLAIEHAIDLIAKTISKLEIQVYKKNKNQKIDSIKNNTYYKLNIKPNPNEYSTSFFYNVISKLLHDEECLIIELNKYLFLADSFDVSNSFILEKTYSNIVLKDSKGNTMNIEKSFKSSEVIHLTLGDCQIKECLDSYYNDFGKLLGMAALNYKASNSPKWKLGTPGNQPTLRSADGKEISYEDYKNKITDGLFSEDEKAILLSDAFKLERLNGDKTVTSSDYRDLEKHWKDEVAMSFNIPLDVFYGSKTDKSTGTNDFITFAVSPHIAILEDGLNGTLIKEQDYLNGEYIYINRLNIKHFDIFDSATSLDKLFGDGFTHNDLCRFLNVPPKDEDWANEPHVTKNYGNPKKGGDED